MKKLITILFVFSVFSIAKAQIKADGKTDNTVALQAWLNGGALTPLPPDTIRITKSLAMPVRTLKNFTMPDALKGAIDLAAFQYVKGSFPAVIEGSRLGTVIWLDNPDKTMPVIEYNAKGDSWPIAGGEIRNITLKGNGIGIAASFVTNLRITNVIFRGFENGLILNNAYFTQTNNLLFYNCQRAEFDISSHLSSFRNTVIGNCKKGFEIRSVQIQIDGYNAQNCYIGLHVASMDNDIRRVVLETEAKTDAQLIIGDTSGVKVDGNIFTRLTISAPNLTAIKFEKTCGEVTIIGGRAESTNFIVVGTPLVDIKNFKGTLPLAIIKK